MSAGRTTRAIDQEAIMDSRSPTTGAGALFMEEEDSQEGTALVQLTVSELEALVDARVKRERKEMEALMDASVKREVEALLKKENNLTLNPREQPPPVERDEEEMKALLDARMMGFLYENKEELKGIVVPLEEEPSKEDETHAIFGETIYTVLYMKEIWSQSFWFSIIVWCIQIAVIALTLADVINRQDIENVLAIPAMVPIEVTIAQALALFMLLAYMSDLIEAVLKLQDQFHPEVLQQHPGATFSKWLFACLAQLAVGLLTLLACLIVTMAAETVIDVMLNLTALLFVTEIDDLGFALANMGFLTDSLQEGTEACKDVQVRKHRKHRTSFRKRSLYFLILMVLFAGYGVIKNRQLKGQYLPTNIYVQFGDAYNYMIPFYSGLMTSGNFRTSGHREYRDMGTDDMLLAYCQAEEAWTFSDKKDPCDYFARSEKTKAYDVTELQDSQWKIKDGGRLKPFDSFSLVGRDCDPEICQGKCVDNLCQCHHGSFGMDCEFENVCPELVLHGRADPFYPVQLNHEQKLVISDEFQLLMDDATGEYARVYFMPVYYSNKTFPANVIFFAGRRWVITTEWDLFDFFAKREANPTRPYFPEETAATLTNEEFHGYDSASYTPFFLSDPVDFNTPDFQPTPSGLGWFTTKVLNETARLYQPDRPVGASLTCADCRVDHGGSCDTGGTCNQTTGVCDCDYGFGPKCELEEQCYQMDRPCLGDGVCDPGSGVCRCNLPFYGKLCDFIYLCIEEPGACRNGGACNVTSGDCICPDDPAITGLACEKRKDCNAFGCENGGRCDKDTGVCDCPVPYEGLLCSLSKVQETQVVACAADPSIQNLLLCPDYFDCSLTGCKNEGICENDRGLCECQEPFAGSDCSEVPDCVSDEDCVGGGWCFWWADGSCECDDVFASGKLCENTSYSGCVTAEDCFNGGICSPTGFCECSNDYTGKRCEFILAEEAYT